MSIEISCPKCGATMERRRRGRDGAEFWGCPRFPACRGTLGVTAVQAPQPVELTQPEAIATVDVERRSSTSVAGGSARAEFERRGERDRERLRRARPALLAFGVVMAVVGLLFTAFGPAPSNALGPAYRMFYLIIVISAVVMTPVAMFALPGSTIAWRTGAIGEERTGEILRPLEAEGFRPIPDRLIPGSRTNIDHIVVGPPRVFIVETRTTRARSAGAGRNSSWSRRSARPRP